MSDTAELVTGEGPTPEQQERIQRYLLCLREVGTHEYARGEVGISEETISRWRKKWKEFDELCEVMRAKGSGQYTKLVSDAAHGRGAFAGRGPNVQAAMFLTGRLSPELRTGAELVKVAGGTTYTVLVPLPVPLEQLPEEPDV